MKLIESLVEILRGFNWPIKNPAASPDFPALALWMYVIINQAVGPKWGGNLLKTRFLPMLTLRFLTCQSKILPSAKATISVLSRRLLADYYLINWFD